MALKLADWSTTPATNTSVDGINVAENCPFSGINNAIRSMMSSVRYEVASFGTNVSASQYADISGPGGAITINGTSTVEGFATAPAGLLRVAHFETATPILAGSRLAAPFTSVTTSKGAIAGIRSLGSGNWKVEYYTPATGYLGNVGAQAITSSSAGTLFTLTSTDAGAGSGPDVVLDRNSASPLADDAIGSIIFQGKDDAGNVQAYVRISGRINDPTSTNEDGALSINTLVGGTEFRQLQIANGVFVGDSIPGTFNGINTLTAPAYWCGSSQVVGTRKTGWSDPSGATTKNTFDTATVTTQQLAQRFAALYSDLKSHGLIGN